MLTAGAIVAGAEDGQINALAEFGETLGNAYQMLDDILDEVEDCSAKSLPYRGRDVHALWQKANNRLKEARDGVVESLADKNPALLIELADKIFSKLKKQAASRLVKDKWHWDSASQDAQSMQTKWQ